jgi:hypothetical protein
MEEQKPKATRDSWQTKPMPEQRARLSLEHRYTPEEFEAIGRGFVPENMDDKWFIYLEQDWLYLHRSWTGLCIFQARFERAGNGHRIAEAWVNRDSEQYNSTDASYDAKLLVWLIEYLLLGRETEMPRAE